MVVDAASVTGGLGDPGQRAATGREGVGPEADHQTRADAVLAEIDSAVSTFIDLLRKQISATTEMISVLDQMQQRLGEFELTEPMSAPPVRGGRPSMSMVVGEEAGLAPPAEMQPEEPSAGRESQVGTPVGGGDSQQPSAIWRSPAHAHRGTAAQLVSHFRRSAWSARLVELPPSLSVVMLRSQLPAGLGVQPGDDGADCKTVLLYSYRGSPPDRGALRVLYRLVDLLSLMSDDHRLMPGIHQLLDVQLQQRLLPIAQGQENHVVARARWRRTVPAIREEVAAVLVQIPPPAKSQLAHLLVQITRKHPRTSARLPDLFKAFRLPMPDEAWIKDILGRGDQSSAIALPLGREPVAPVQPPMAAGPLSTDRAVAFEGSSSTPEPQRLAAERHHNGSAVESDPLDPMSGPHLSSAIDVERLAATRASTLRARQELLDLDDHSEDEPPSSDHEPLDSSSSSSEHALEGPHIELAQHLSQQEEHALADVRSAARQLGLVPLEAVRIINEWAELRADSAEGLPEAVVEIDENAATVWVAPSLKELLS